MKAATLMVLAFALVTGSVATAQVAPTPEQISIIQRANCSLTRVVPTPIYHGDGYYIDGHINMCSEEKPWLDVSVGSSAPKPGEVFVFVYGRFFLGQKYNQHQSIMFQRGRPNTFYPVRGDVKEAMFTAGTVSGAAYNWKNAEKILPFMPTAVHDQGVLPGGRHWYAYSGLRFVPGMSAHPLDADSIVIAIDGVSFNAPHAFSGPLEYPAPGQEWVEVIYFQRNDVNGPIRRAYLPFVPKARAGGEWDRMVDANPIFQRNYVAAAVVVLVLGKAIYELANSPIGQQLQRDYEECERRKATARGILIC